MNRSLISFFVFLAAVTSGVSQPSAYFQPKVAGWVIESQPEVYAGDDLFFLIDGGADLYLEYGFKEVAVANYINDNMQLRVEVYEMTNAARAWGVFSVRRPFPSLSGSTQFMAFGDGYVMAVRGDDYIVVSGQHGAANPDDCKLFVDNFLVVDSGTQQYEIAHKLLLTLDQQQQGVLFFGRAGLSSVYSLGSSSFQNFVTGTAQKSVSQGLLSKLLIELSYESAEAALSDFNLFRENAFNSERYTKKQEVGPAVLLHDRDKSVITLHRTGDSILISISPL